MTREEALNEIKSWAIPSEKGREVLETLIPELVESEDERIRKWLLDYAIEMIAGLESDISLSTYDGVKGHDPEAEAELAQWQKARAYLEKQKEQKPEWSEEDDLNCNRIIRFLEPHKTFFPTKETKEEMQNWIKTRLKSLRPSWKPSEEQMEALEYVISDYREDSCNATANYLQEILDHLKNM